MCLYLSLNERAVSVYGKTVLTVDVFSKDFHTFVLYLELIEL